MSVRIKLKRKLRRMRETKYITRGIVILLVIVIIACAAFGLYEFVLIPKIDLRGKNTMVVDYNSKYVEKGYKASFLGNDITDEVEVKGKVNPKKLGVYEITYKVKSGLFTRTVTRKVVVQDREKPKLDINSDDLYICPGDEIVPEKVKATDNYDGDLTKKVKNIIGDNKIIYRVTDSSGNTRVVEKKVYFKDKEKPSIKLNGPSLAYVFLGGKYTDTGVTVEDNCDKNVEKNIKIENTVDSSKIGEYSVTYSVKDASGNENKIVRKVKVCERNKVGTIYLTFDDGPNSGTTDVILDILKEEGVEATFFVTNRGPDNLIKREFDEGHTVALHTASHNYATVYASVDAYFSDLYSVQNRVKRITGYESKIIRFPGGSSNTVSRRYSPGIMTTLTKETVNRGFRYYDWNLSSGDAAGGQPTADDIYNNVVSNLRHDRVNMVLMHDIKPYTRDALRKIIRYGKDNGYTFEKMKK